MSQLLINRNAELKRLRDEGYNVHTNATFLIVDNVWYVAADRSLKKGRLVTDLPLAGDQISGMGTHVMHFAGEQPCDSSGNPLNKQRIGEGEHHRPDTVTNHTFSSKLLGPEGQM